jgi:sugar phosphate isomerase/epimerase
MHAGHRDRQPGARRGPRGNFGLCRAPYLVGSQRPEAWLGETRTSIDMAAALGTSVLTVVSGGTEPGTPRARSRRRRSSRNGWLKVVRPRGCLRQVSLALEPLNPMFGGNRTCLMTVRDALDVCEMVDRRRLSASRSTSITCGGTADWRDSCAAASSRIIGYHLCDWLEDTADMLLDRGMMGDGVADLRAIRHAVESEWLIPGPCEVEIFSREPLVASRAR